MGRGGKLQVNRAILEAWGGGAMGKEGHTDSQYKGSYDTYF